MSLIKNSAVYTSIKLNNTSITRMLLNSTSYFISPSIVAPQSVFKGFDNSVDYGTVFDFYVSTTGSDLNPGSSALPYATIQHAARTNPGKTIGVRGGVYRQEVVFGPTASGTVNSPTLISRYGTESVVLTGSEVIPTSTLCTAADSSALGPDYVNMYKFNINLSNIASGEIIAINLIDDDVPMVLAGEFGKQPFHPRDNQALADWEDFTPVLNGTTVSSWQNFSITSKYSQQEIEDSVAYFHAYPNVGAISKITSYNTSTGLINLQSTGYVYEADSFKNRFALRNLPRNIKPGQFAGIVDPGNTFATIYFWPKNPGNIAANKIEYCSRVRGVSYANANHIHIRGIQVKNISSADTNELSDHYPFVSDGGTIKTNISIKNVLVKNCFRPMTRGYGAFYMRMVNDLTIDQFTVDGAYGSFGMFISGNSVPATLNEITSGLVIARGVFMNISFSPIRVFTQRDALILHCHFKTNCGVAAHANKCNTYAGCHNVLFYGCNMMGASGYVTWQQASKISYINCLIPSNYLDVDNRSVADQNDTVNTPAQNYGVNGQGYFLNCIMLPDNQNMAGTNNVDIGRNPAVPFEVSNCILHGSLSLNYPNLTRSNNVITGGATTGNEIFSAPADVYVDPFSGDFRIKSDSIVKTATTLNRQAVVSSIIAGIPRAAPYSQLLTLDVNGDVMNWSAPPMGCSNTYSFNHSGATWINEPIPSGTPAIGSVVSFTGGFHAPMEFPRSYQWYESTDSIVWNPILTETNVDYTVAPGDINKFLGCDITVQNNTLFRFIDSQIISNFPLGDPQVASAGDYGNVFSGLAYQTTPFTLENRPLIVEVYARTLAAADAVATVTVGSPDRAVGTGAQISDGGLARRSIAQISYHFIQNPGSGSNTIQVNLTGACTSVRILAYYVDNAVGVSTSFSSTGLTAATGSIMTINRTVISPLCIVAGFGMKQTNIGGIIIDGPGFTELASSANFAGAYSSAWKKTSAQGATEAITLTSSSTTQTAATIFGAYEILSS